MPAPLAPIGQVWRGMTCPTTTARSALRVSRRSEAGQALRKWHVCAFRKGDCALRGFAQSFCSFFPMAKQKLEWA
eukprot:11404675-Alexandrium_andersonii.AAC.1